MNRIDNYYGKKFSLDECVSRLVGQDGISFNQIANSVTLKHLFALVNYNNVPDHAWTVRTKAMNFYNDVIVRKVVEQIQNGLKSSKLVAILDEWTSEASPRYMNVTIVSKDKLWNIGLERIFGDASALNLRKTLEEKLNAFKINFDDLTAIVTDGASVMVCLGNSLKPVHQQLCFAHAIQLAVVKTLYGPTVERTDYEILMMI